MRIKYTNFPKSYTFLTIYRYHRIINLLLIHGEIDKHKIFKCGDVHYNVHQTSTNNI